MILGATAYTIIVETTFSTMVSGLKLSITVVPAIFVRTFGSTKLAGASITSFDTIAKKLVFG